MGGAEKVMSFIYNNISRNLFSPSLLVIGFERDNCFELVDNQVLFLRKSRLRNSYLRIINHIQKGNYDIVFSSSFQVNIFLAIIKCFFPKKKFIIREASIYSEMKAFRNKSLIPVILRNFFYRKMDKIIFQSSDMKNDFTKLFNINNNFILINNPLQIIKTPKINKHSKRCFNLINVGSLEPLKGHKRIIELIGLSKMKFNLYIYGSGSLKTDIEKQIKELNLKKNILLKGSKKNIHEIYGQYDYYIQGSFLEGFPNALLEALGNGLPCLVFKSPGGHNEMIIEGFNGYFIEEGVNEEKILDFFLNRNWDRLAIQKDVYKRFSSQKIINQYESLFLDIIK
jgi:hypothetical protein